MGYLIFAILLGTVVTVGYKYITLRDLDGNTATIVNYATAFCVSCCLSFSNGGIFLLQLKPGGGVSRLFTEPGVSATRWILYTVGIPLGIIFLGNVLLIKNSVGANGAGNTDFFNRMGFLVCVIASIFIWKEIPTPFQFLGIGMLTAAFLLLLREFSRAPISKPVYLGLLVFIGGLRDLCNKIYAYYALPQYKIVFLTAAYFTALAFCLLIYTRKYRNGSWRPRCSKKTLAIGALLGISNVMNTALQLKSLELISAAVVIPLFAAGTLLLGNILNTLLFGEPVKGGKVLAVLLASSSIVLMNL